eukprot:6206130-Pleurochrysis_carterae.AAC.2
MQGSVLKACCNISISTPLRPQELLRVAVIQYDRSNPLAVARRTAPFGSALGQRSARRGARRRAAAACGEHGMEKVHYPIPVYRYTRKEPLNCVS